MNGNSIFRGDKYLWGIYIVLCVISIIEVYSSSSYLGRRSGDFLWQAMRQMMFVGCGTLFVFGIHVLHYKWCKLVMLALIPVSLTLLIISLFAGRWLNVGISIQPSEIAKLNVILLLAFILAKFQDPERNGAGDKAFKYSVIITFVACLLICKDNLSTAMLLGLVSFCMMMIARVETKKLLTLMGVVLVCLSILLSISVMVYKYERGTGKPFPVLSELRLSTWGGRIVRHFDDSGEDDKDLHFQEQYASMAVANSRVVGVWPGNSWARDYLPEAYSDFIYAIILEEMGLAGGIFVMALYLSLLLRAGYIARRCEKAYPAFLITGLAMMIVFQALINMGVSVGLLPVTGQPLPLVSRGGSSFILISIYFGIMLSVSRFAKQTGQSEESVESLTEESGDISAPNPV